MTRYSGWFGRYAGHRCPHSTLEGIYGDRINEVGGWRLHCLDCGRYLNGPVALAESRRREAHGPIVAVDQHATQARCQQCGWVGPDRTGDPHAAGLVVDDVDWHLEVVGS